ncbi:hypothetical protein FACS1894185_1190 [Betaproteobacteria bacterium]|nr:hypothetical protein FACS1894185_1190 [Betaproteobacteria bacterium]
MRASYAPILASRYPEAAFRFEQTNAPLAHMEQIGGLCFNPLKRMRKNNYFRIWGELSRKSIFRPAHKSGAAGRAKRTILKRGLADIGIRKP